MHRTRAHHAPSERPLRAANLRGSSDLTFLPALTTLLTGANNITGANNRLQWPLSQWDAGVPADRAPPLVTPYPNVCHEKRCIPAAFMQQAVTTQRATNNGRVAELLNVLDADLKAPELR